MPYQEPDKTFHSDPAKGLHPNRSHSVPTAGGPGSCISAKGVLEARVPAAWGSEQSAAVAATGQTDSKSDDKSTWTKKWYARGHTLKVPKAVVLSSHPNWTLYWPKGYFYMPRDIINLDGLGRLGNYYYLDQWNGLDPDASAESEPDYSFLQGDGPYDATNIGYQNNRAWKDMRAITAGDKSSVYNARASCFALEQDGCPDIPSYLFNKCTEPPGNERFQKEVGRVDNPYYEAHAKLTKAFIAAKKVLEADRLDPIFVSIPTWTPPTLRQVRNAYLKRSHEIFHQKANCSSNYYICDHWVDVCWAPPYPDVNDPRNDPGFQGPSVPWLMSPNPGFGTNSLHLYIGHPNMAYTTTSKVFDYQAFPKTPEATWFAGPVFGSTYLGADSLPFFAGRRARWGIGSSEDYGYGGAGGAAALYDSYYSGIVSGAADDWKQNYWKYRDTGTRIFTYDAQWQLQWALSNLERDREEGCRGIGFYFGFTFEDFVAAFGNDESVYTDCSQSEAAGETHLKIYDGSAFFPWRTEIQRAEYVGSVIASNVSKYYNGIEPGAEAFFKLAIDRNDLKSHNVSCEGRMPADFLDADGIVAYVRQYFAVHR